MLTARHACVAALALVLAPAVQARTIGSIAFTPCELESRGNGRVEAECARFDVPENPRASAGRRITLQMALLAARTVRPERDLVVMLAGGPGQSALQAYAEITAALEPLRRHRHILLLDQRGTGKSNPLKCALPDWKDPAQQTAAAVRQQAATCLAALSDRADPRFYTTSEAVHDLEAVRLALGAPRYDLIGGSYGTRVALEYLRRHPGGVRTVVLDSAVPPELALLQDHARNLDDALGRVFAACRADAVCGQRYGDPWQTLQALRARLRAAPEPARTHDPRTHAVREEALTETLLAGIARLYAYQPELAALLPLLLDEARAGRPQALIAQGDLTFEHLTDALAHGMELSVVCTEDVPFLEVRPADADTVLGTAMITLLQEQCSLWPRGTLPSDFKEPVTSDAPVLLLSGELDPVTPPRYAQQLARTLSNSRHLVVRGQGHTLLARGCIPKILRRFVDSAAPATVDAACLDAMGAPPAFTSYQGPEP